MIPFIPGGGTAPARTLTDWLEEVYPCLNAADSASLVHWAQAELVEWANEGQGQLARGYAMWVERDASTTTVASTASYSLPARHLSTIHVTLAGRSMRAANVRELEALSATWTVDACAGTVTPTWYCQDDTGTTSIRLYKIPNAAETLAVLYHEYPADLTASSAPDMPEVVGDWLFFHMVGEARRKESDAAMPEAAKFCSDVMAVYEQVFENYWGVRV